MDGGGGFAQSKGHIAALQNGLDVFDLFTLEQPVVTVADISRRLGIHKSTASRIAATLAAAGFLRPAITGTGYQLGGKMTRLGSIAAAETSLTTVSLPVLRALVDDLGETCHLGVLEGNEAVTVALVDGSHAVRLHSFVGKRSLAHCTAMGKVLLAALPQARLDELFETERLMTVTSRSVASRTELYEQLENVRRRGYAVDDEELEIGLRCIAAPVRGNDGHVVASLTVAGAAPRIPINLIDRYAEDVIEKAEAISRALGAPEALGIVSEPEADDFRRASVRN